MPSHMRKFLLLRVLVVVEIGASGLRFGALGLGFGFWGQIS